MQAINQGALKSIKKSAKQSALRTGGKELSIWEGNLVLLWDHLEGCNKIQDHFKDHEFVVVKQLHKPNAHDNSDNTSDKEVSNIPSFNPKVKLKETHHTHKYATQAKGQPSTWVPEDHSWHGNGPL